MASNLTVDLSGAVSFIWLGLGQHLGLLPNILMTFYIDVVMLPSQLSGITIKVGEINPLVIVGYCLIVTGVVISLKK